MNVAVVSKDSRAWLGAYVLVNKVVLKSGKIETMLGREEGRPVVKRTVFMLNSEALLVTMQSYSMLATE